MSIDIETAKIFIVAHIFEHGNFRPRQDLLIDGNSIDPSFSGKHLRVHSSRPEAALNQLVEDGVLIEMLAADLLEEIIRTGTAEDDSFTDRDDIIEAEQFVGDSVICFGPRLNFFVLENFSQIMEYSEDNDLGEFKRFCLEVCSSASAYGPKPDVMISRKNNVDLINSMEAQLAEIEQRLLDDNDLSSDLMQQKTELAGEVRMIRRLISQDVFRAAFLYDVTKRTLNWIVEQSAEAVVGAVALAAIAKITGLIG